MNSPVQQGYQGVALVAPVSFGYERFSTHDASYFIGSALAQLLAQTGLQKNQIDGLAVASFSMQPDSVASLTEHFGMTVGWLEQLPFGGSSGVAGMRRAARAIQAGDAQIVAVIGGDTNQKSSFKATVSGFSRFSNQGTYPYGAAGPNMPFSLITQHYMDKFAVTREDFGRIAVSQRYNANHYDGALLGHKKLAMKDYIGAREIAGPLHLFDCVMPCAGAEAFFMMSVEQAQKLGQPWVEIAGAQECYNAYPEDAVQYRGGWDLFADKLYQQADVTPADIDILQTYDDYPVISMLQMEGLGFCKQGEAAQFVRETSLNFDGSLPEGKKTTTNKTLAHNTSGGQLSVGQAGAGAGLMGVVESMRQLMGQAKTNQVDNAKLAMVSGYGMINYDRGLCASAAILKQAGV